MFVVDFSTTPENSWRNTIRDKRGSSDGEWDLGNYSSSVGIMAVIWTLTQHLASHAVQINCLHATVPRHSQAAQFFSGSRTSCHRSPYDIGILIHTRSSCKCALRSIRLARYFRWSCELDLSIGFRYYVCV